MQATLMLQFLHSEGIPFDARTITEAIGCQELPLLQWLCEHGCNLCEVDPLAYREQQTPEALRWLHSKGCPCDYGYMCHVAASTGNIITLQWAKDNAVVDWSPEVLSVCLNAAAAHNKLDTAKVSTALTTLIALSRLHERVHAHATARYASLSCMTALQLTSTLCMCAVVQWLRQEGADWPLELKYGAKQWPDASIAWCRLEGCDSPLELGIEVDNEAIVDQA
jgi:hypothetical protein